ncbi:DUF4179 domain-containing protein [Bacillus horti]|uniref:DUF4179 domain-containing protein n=1 Tax=Caldalkalibacillus horti TaxID=77523 RepID=A0ABT9VVJ4_9BACI|nr:DUF4179 domain-containing protein [Bacillus horti]MDQ0165006.1 hypothetical protein [Bacillus horti]
MERIEDKLKNQLKTSKNIAYPNFDRMWSSIQQDELKAVKGEPVAFGPRKRKRFAIVAALSLALVATQVYAAVTFDWSTLLSGRSGIQSALEQGIGQTIGQSVTKDDITLTVHTAFTDDNRTFLLYSLRPDSSWEGQQVLFDLIGLKDNKGNFIEGNYTHQWDEERGEYQGYFETNWVLEEDTEDMEFTMENIRFIGEEQQQINYDPRDSSKQVFRIEKDGIGHVAVDSFEQADDIMLQSSITFTDPDVKERSLARIQAIDGQNKLIKEVNTSVFGTPSTGTSNEYVNQQIFSSDSLLNQGTKFQLVYTHTLGTAENDWSIDMALSKKYMENASFTKRLNLPLDQLPGGTEIYEMIVTPTQARLVLTHEEEYTRVPYMNLKLDIGGTLLEGGVWQEPAITDKTELRFEMIGLDSSAIENQPVTLIARHRVDLFDGDEHPIQLTGISEEPQSLTTYIEEYPITWTYYLKDNNLYVESMSSDSDFGGINQTYYLEDRGRRSYGKPAIVGMFGSGSNSRMDVYENFEKDELEILIWKYTAHNRDDELRVPLK